MENTKNMILSNNLTGSLYVEEILMKTIICKLSLVRVNVELLGNLTLFDINKFSENFFANLLSIIRGTKYVNLNFEKKNTKAIDIIDRINKVVIQVTSDNSSAKVEDTVKKFKETKYATDNYELQMLIISKTKNFQKKYDIKILFLEDLIEEIENIKEISKKREICTFLDENINLQISPQIIDITDCNIPTRPKNIMKFYETFDIAMDHKGHKIDLEIINKYINKLCNVDYETRIFLSLIANLMYKFTNYKKIVTQTSATSLKWLNTNILENSIPYWGNRGMSRVLEDMDKLELIIYDHSYIGPEASVAFRGYDKWTSLVYDLIVFSKTNKIDIKDFFEKLDFSSLAKNDN